MTAGKNRARIFFCNGEDSTLNQTFQVVSGDSEVEFSVGNFDGREVFMIHGKQLNLFTAALNLEESVIKLKSDSIIGHAAHDVKKVFAADGGDAVDFDARWNNGSNAG